MEEKNSGCAGGAAALVAAVHARPPVHAAASAASLGAESASVVVRP